MKHIPANRQRLILMILIVHMFIYLMLIINILITNISKYYLLIN